MQEFFKAFIAFVEVILCITGLRPVSVIGFEGTKTERNLRRGAKGGAFGIEMVTFENGGIAKSLHGGLYKGSIWYSIYGSKGRMESSREDEKNDAYLRILVNADEYSGQYSKTEIENYKPKKELDENAKGFGHGGSDFYSMYHFVEKLRGNENADIIDVYEALDMFLPGMFAYRSVLNGGIPMEIPNLRNKEEREKWRNDTACTAQSVAGEQLIPTFSKGTPEIDDAVYEEQKRLWLQELESNAGYTKAAFEQGEKK